MKNKMIILLFFSHTSLFALDKPPNSLFEKGNTFYNKGDYQNAMESYLGIIENGYHSSEVYYNLGNTNYKIGNVAETNYYFEKAKMLSPNDEMIINNLEFAKNMTMDSIETLPQTQINLFFNDLLAFMTTDNWSMLTMLTLWIVCILFLIYSFSKSIFTKRIFFSSGVLSFLIFIFFIYITISKHGQENIKKGIIFDKEIGVWTEPNQRTEVLFFLHEGTKLKIIDELEGWSKILISNGSEGWIENNSVRLLN